LSRVVRQFVENHIHVVLVGPRRFGKTSFILQTLSELEQSGRTTIFIDIYNITSHRDFLGQIIRALKQKQSWQQRLREWAAHLPRLRAKLNLDVDQTTGAVGFSVVPDLSQVDLKELIQDALKALSMIGAEVVVAFDEFQTIAELDDDGWLEATLRTTMQSLTNATFIFSGSRRRMIHEMINDSKRPFFRSCQPIEFPSFGAELTDWVIARFGSIGVTGDRDALENLRLLVQDTPNYVQMACFHLVASGVGHVGQAEVQGILQTIVKQNSYAYQTLLNSLTHIQQRALRLAANEGKEIFSKALLAQYEIGSGPALASAIKSLKQKQIIDEGTSRGVVTFDDPLFAIWLRSAFG
jgi:hypothetical protein